MGKHRHFLPSERLQRSSSGTVAASIPVPHPSQRTSHPAVGAAATDARKENETCPRLGVTAGATAVATRRLYIAATVAAAGGRGGDDAAALDDWDTPPPSSVDPKKSGKLISG